MDSQSDLPDTPNSDRPTHELKENLTALSAKIVQFGALRTDREVALKFYKTEILPHLLQLRRLNRLAKDKLEEKHAEISDMNRRLINLYKYSEDLKFEASCLDDEVVRAKREQIGAEGNAEMKTEAMSNGNDMSFFDADKIASLDHETRISLLEEQETERKRRRDELSQLMQETEGIEKLCHLGESELNMVKPHIKQLVERVEPMEPLLKAIKSVASD